MQNLTYELIRSSRKTLSVQIRPDGTVLVRAPMRMSQRQIQQFLQEKSDWILEHQQKVLAAREQASQAPLTEGELRALADQAMTRLPPVVREYARRMGVTYGKITIRNQKTRWGSCSSQGNLNFNCLLMLAPEEVQTYVVVHELAHRKQMNHSPAFWAEVAAVIPDYKRHVKWLKDNGGVLMARMTGGD